MRNARPNVDEMASGSPPVAALLVDRDEAIVVVDAIATNSNHRPGADMVCGYEDPASLYLSNHCG